MLIPFGGGTWEAKVGDYINTMDGASKLILEPIGEGQICGDSCDQISNAAAQIFSKVELTPSVEGISVPTAAVRTAADSSNYVVDEKGNEIEVKVLGTSGGISIVEGVEEGTVVQLNEEQS